MDSPVGHLRLRASGDVITHVEWSDRGTEEKNALLDEACRQLSAYFERKLSVFELPLAPTSSAFQQCVHEAMLDILMDENVESSTDEG